MDPSEAALRSVQEPSRMDLCDTRRDFYKHKYIIVNALSPFLDRSDLLEETLGIMVMKGWKMLHNPGQTTNFKQGRKDFLQKKSEITVKSK